VIAKTLPDQALARRDKIIQAIAETYPTGAVCQGAAFRELVDLILAQLPKGIPLDVLTDSVRNLAGTPLTDDIVRATAWRLAGNVDYLKNRSVVPPWSRQSFRESVPAQILQLTKAMTGRGKHGYQVALSVLGGTPCPATILQFWSNTFCNYLAKVVFGFAKWSPRPGSGLHYNVYSHPLELVTLRCRVIIDPQHCRGGQPGFEKIQPGFSEWNRQQMRRRVRDTPEYICPAGHPMDVPCFTCARGWMSCRAACHKFDYELRSCPQCKQPSVPFDPWLGGKVCLRCAEHNALNPG
jgi:hypothetical protein